MFLVLCLLFDLMAVVSPFLPVLVLDVFSVLLSSSCTGLFLLFVDVFRCCCRSFFCLSPFSGLYRDWETDRKSTRLNSSHSAKPRMPSSA